METEGRSYQLIAGATAMEADPVDWGRLLWIANRAGHDVEATVGYVEIHPNSGNPIHRHNTCSEIMVVLEGHIRHIVGEESVDLTPGDALVVPPGMRHGAINIGDETARMIVVYDTGQRDFEVAD